MKDICQDLLEEYRQLDALCATLGAGEWRAPTGFFRWSPWDEVAHLCLFDETGLQAVTDPDSFRRDADVLNARTARGEEIEVIARDRFGRLDGPGLLALWRSRYVPLVAALAPLDAKARLPWYGPPMSARSFATARLMETWAHGQDIWDLLRRRRPPSARLRHIAHLGVSTFAWSFVNRGLPVPAPVPCVVLDGPDGAQWRWGSDAPGNEVRGSAEDFCLVVTQRRNVADTALQVSGEPARQWLRIAQCFAGQPEEPPAPGARTVPE